jgi:hypothetical protein
MKGNHMSETSNSETLRGPWNIHTSTGEIKRWLGQGVDPELLVTPRTVSNPDAGSNDAAYNDRTGSVYSIAPETAAARKLGGQALNVDEAQDVENHKVPEPTYE